MPFFMWAAFALAMLMVTASSKVIVVGPAAVPVGNGWGVIGYAIALGVIILAGIYAIKIWRKP
jgi:hypothetical protein